MIVAPSRETQEASGEMRCVPIIMEYSKDFGTLVYFQSVYYEEMDALQNSAVRKVGGVIGYGDSCLSPHIVG